MKKLLAAVALCCFALNAQAQQKLYLQATQQPGSLSGPGVPFVASDGSVSIQAGTDAGAMSKDAGNAIEGARSTLCGKAGITCITPLDYGMKCDGATDDSAGFIALAAGATGTVVFPAGQSCIVSGTSGYNFANAVSLQGQNQTATIKVKNGTVTPVGGFLAWLSGNVTVSGITIDLNNMAEPGVVVPILQFATNADVHIDNIRVINAPSHTLLTSFVSVKRIFLTNSFMSLTTAANDNNGCVLVSKNTTNPTEVHIYDNVCENTSMYIDAAYGDVHDNDVYGWQSGSGIVLGGSLLTTKQLHVHHNRTHDNGTLIDANNVCGSGVESWATNAILDHNMAWNIAGDALSSGGKNTLISSNMGWNYGKCTNGARTDYAGVHVAWTSSSLNGSGSVVFGNTTFEDDSSSKSTYGYQDDNAGITGVTLGPNQFRGIIAAYRKTATGYVNWDAGNITINNSAGAITTGVILATGLKVGAVTASAVDVAFGPAFSPRSYNSITDVNNSEWAYLGDWTLTANAATFGTNKNGSGTVREVQLARGGAITLVSSANGYTLTGALNVFGTGAGLVVSGRNSGTSFTLYNDASLLRIFNGGDKVTFDTTGLVNAVSGYAVNGTAGVSCSTGILNPVTAVVTNGIITHC